MNKTQLVDSIQAKLGEGATKKCAEACKCEAKCRCAPCECGDCKCAEKCKSHFGYESYIVLEDGGFAFISRPMNGAEAKEALADCKKELRWMMPVLD